MIYDIREYKQDDVSAMKSLWCDAFGDLPELVDSFFELLPSMGTGFVAELDGEVFGAAYVLDAFLHLPDSSTKKLAYIYAVAVDGSVRGHGVGAELTRACMRNAWEYSADICCTLPAEGSLYDWYESRCGLAAASFCCYETVAAGAEAVGICDVTRSVSKMTEIERRGGKRWDKPKKAEKSRDCGGGKF